MNNYQINPTIDLQSSTGFYIPTTLFDAFVELEKMLPPELLSEIQFSADTIAYHFTIGLWIRNNWGLWSDSFLAQSLKAQGFGDTPDDQSGFILESFQQHLKQTKIFLKSC